MGKLILLILLLFAGCKYKILSAPPKGEKTAIAQVRHIYGAVLRNDKHGFEEGFWLSPEDSEWYDVVSSHFSVFRAIAEFKNKVVRQYGEKGWQLFKPPPVGRKNGATLYTYTQDEYDKLESEATVTDESPDSVLVVLRSLSFRLIKRNGLWYCDPQSLNPEKFTPARHMIVYKRVIRLLTDYGQRVEAKDASIDKINEQMAIDLVKAEVN